VNGRNKTVIPAENEWSPRTVVVMMIDVAEAIDVAFVAET
jgi:hypothetical protein